MACGWPPVRPRSTMRSCSALSIAAGSGTAGGDAPASRFRCWYGPAPRMRQVCHLVGTSGARCAGTPGKPTPVLTRLPRDLRLAPMDAARLLTERFAAPLLLRVRTADISHACWPNSRSLGGAVYDISWPLPPLGFRHTRSSQGHLRSASPRESADSSNPIAVRSRSPPTCPPPGYWP